MSLSSLERGCTYITNTKEKQKTNKPQHVDIGRTQNGKEWT
jgi:hypothetical protein